MPAFTAILIGDDTLTIEAGRLTLAAGHRLTAVVTEAPRVADWARAAGLPVLASGADVPVCDWILSVANLRVLPPAVLARARQGAVNFHDGPLPAHAGLNAPVWALLMGEARHGITWHLIEGKVDAGRILSQVVFDLAPEETALSLNARCLAAALESFPAVLRALEAGVPDARPQVGPRSRHLRHDRPAGLGQIDPAQGTAAALRLIRALDHGGYANPLTSAKILLGETMVLIGRAEAASGQGTPGEVLSAEGDAVVLATSDGAIRLAGLTDKMGQPVAGTAGDRVTLWPTEGLAAHVRAEPYWRAGLMAARPVTLPPLGGPQGETELSAELAHDLPPLQALARLALALGPGQDFGFARPVPSPLIAPVVPVRAEGSEVALAAAMADLPPAPSADLWARLGQPAPPRPAVMLATGPGGRLPGSQLTLRAEAGRLHLFACPQAISPAAFALWQGRVAHWLSGQTGLPPAERALVTEGWNQTARAFDRRPLTQVIAERARRTPAAPALTFEDRTLDFATLQAQAEALARRLTALGVGRGDRVGLHLPRSAGLVIGALAILQTGAAYVPLDPAYPAERIALYIEDSGLSVILSHGSVAPTLPEHKAQVLRIDAASPEGPAPEGPTEDDLAYLIYTSGSTGRPKGVMVTHRNLSNFCAGMDERLPQDPPGTWLAVTSPSFDISVLEMVWTLSRGARVVLSGDESRTLVAGAPSQAGMEFSLYYWGNDDGAGRDKYALLLEGARFADQHGFRAVWTPERHFHAFGGPYPNPSVTGAAVAAVTRNLDIRAGSCVAPLHHPARIAEEWAVIDNLTGGRAGIAFAAGWQPEDFVLRPEAAPPANKAALLTALDQVRRLWRGEAVSFPGAAGTEVALRSQPRPVSAELPVWLTTAGNPETWAEAGRLGAHVLTHLLGQSIAEVGEKIAIYHKALRQAGHDPRAFKVTLMLHTYLAETREAAREVARGPMKEYLRSAAGLIKQYAWAFPAFKKPQGAASPADVDLRSLDPAEMEAILDFAFQRYFDESGLFGTIEDALLRKEQLAAIGVTEIACLIDFGIARETVLAGLRPLAEVVARTKAAATPAEGDFSIAAQIRRHGVTHLQCTPSLARMLVTNDDSRRALGQLRQLLIGGEALPASLVADLRAATPAAIENMYGPTETTIWSTTRRVTGVEGAANIGRPIANTRVLVLDEAMQPVPVGAEGELWIGGEGVARGYWQRPDLTAERFVDDPFHPGGRLYRTGDLVRWTADGTLDFLGRADGQIKLRGHRIEMSEIEAALDRIPGVVQSVVLLREDGPGLQSLIAWTTGPDQPPEAAIKAALARELPAHLVPARVVALEAFPLTPNKKIDRKALPAPATLRLVAPPAPLAPAPVTAGSAETLGQVAALWSRLLGVPLPGPQDHFFDLGGHSLLAVQAHRDLREALDLPALSITDIFRFPRLSDLAARIDSLRPRVAEGPAAPPLSDPRAAARQTAMAQRRALRAARGG